MSIQYFRRIYPSGYLDRLSKLMEARLQPGADKSQIDASIWELFGERWAVMFTDLAGFSRKAADFGIIHFLQVIYEAQRIFTPVIDAHNGILIKMDGDSMLILFRRPASAVNCAIEMQRAAWAYNAEKAEPEKILLCVGIGYGEILTIGEQDVYGAQVNAASKLGEDMAEAWEILITEDMAGWIRDLPGIRLEKSAFVPPGAKGAARVIYQFN